MKENRFPIVLALGIAAAAIFSQLLRAAQSPAPEALFAPDTVCYEPGGYKLLRKAGRFEQVSLEGDGNDSLYFGSGMVEDSLASPRILARDTVKIPDSLRLTDPFRFKYYVAIIDSLEHVMIHDSLQFSGDSLMASCDTLRERLDTAAALRDSLLAESDWFDMRRIDTLYFADSAAKAKAAFEAWYNSLSKEDRKKYDFEQKELAKLAVRDSLDKLKEEKKAEKDSIIKETPRILSTPFIPDSMQYKRHIAWTESRDFGDFEPYVPDTSYNHYFHDYAWQRKDVNVSWLGVAGSPVQYYNFFNRESITGVEFWEPNEAWSFSPQTLVQYNTKSPHTELAYWGTLLSTTSKSSDNVHILTTQNITPAMNFSILYDRWGGNGMMDNESVKNKVFATGFNYLGEKYLANAGFITNSVNRGENDGMTDIFWVRDTVVDTREYPVELPKSSSTAKKLTFYADQQLRIPFNFINDIKARKDTTFVPDSSAEVTTAFIGHAFEYSKFQRQFLPDGKNPEDSLGQQRIDNKLYLRLQPWSSDAFVSKIDVGIGDYFHKYNFVDASGRSDYKENSVYTYAGIKGRISDKMDWGANARSVFAGADAGNSELSAHLTFRFYPFRKARYSPVSLSANASSTLLRPTFFQRHNYTSWYQWDHDDFKMASTTKVEGEISIPWWKFEARAGYALLDGNIYFGQDCLPVQNNAAMSVFSAFVRKEFSLFGDFLHLDNRVLAQISSNQDVVPLPALALNLRYYIQFPVTKNVLTMQIGADAWANTEWFSPAWDPQIGIFHNQTQTKYTNGPFFDLFVNMQWKKACIFVKLQNFGEGWPLDRPDYFSADRFIVTSGGMTGLKIGIWWPFFTSPVPNRKVGSGSSSSAGEAGSSNSGVPQQ